MRFIIALLIFLAPIAKANFVMFGPTSSAAVTTTSGQIIPSNSLRVYLIMVNTGTNTVYVKAGAVQSTATDGIPILPGGNYEPFLAPANNIYADTSTGSSTIEWQEGQ